MPNTDPEQHWKSYLATELPLISSILTAHHYTLDQDQPHLKGERFLMQAVTTSGGKKFILYGKDTTGRRVVIKATRDPSGKREIIDERTSRTKLHQLKFAYEVFHSPQELAFITEQNFIISITEYIEQTTTFLERPVAEQFSYCLTALKAQECARATTAGHIRHIKKIFNFRTSADYLKLFADFADFITINTTVPEVIPLITEVADTLTQKQTRIEQYCGFLTHTDFVPHNFRIRDNTLYLLDFSSLQFGNKHESWARLLNFMTLYNPTLESALISYVEDNRAPEERESLQLMRLFRLGELIGYHVKNTQQSSGDLQTLSEARVRFWGEVLQAELHNTRVSRDIVTAYQTNRDHLRSPEEKQRQVGLH